jgi:hypothetical protein
VRQQPSCSTAEASASTRRCMLRPSW